MKKGKKEIKKHLKKPVISMEYDIEEVSSRRAVFRKYPEFNDDKWPRNWN